MKFKFSPHFLALLRAKRARFFNGQKFKLVVRKQKLVKNVKIEKNKEFIVIFFLNLVCRCTTTMEI